MCYELWQYEVYHYTENTEDKVEVNTNVQQIH